MRETSFFAAFLLARASLGAPDNLYRIPSALSNTSSIGIFTSTALNLDAPKVLPINASTFDWWYFDVVDTNPNSRASAAVVFYNTGPTALPFISIPGTTLSAQVIVSFPNGTLSSAPGIAVADRATVLTSDNGSSGQWHGAGIAWTHSVYSGAWEILIDSPELGMKGSIHLKPVSTAAPSHYPCGPAVAGQSLAVGPHIGWANAIPDAVSTVDLVVDGTRLDFTGAGYHDKNWSDQPFAENVISWYWGHGRVGPYSIVWFDFLATNGVEHVSAYAAKDGKILVSSCDLSSIRVRPTGENATYPPLLTTGPPSGYHITLDLGAEDGVLEL
ncbi:hypothetical protein DFH08DRAFT_1019939, partial [Mycena albidolilacea]